MQTDTSIPPACSDSDNDGAELILTPSTGSVDSVAALDIPLKKWMSHIRSGRYLSELSIPGSHETCATISVPWVQCQHMSIVKQLDAGIRYIDFRCGVSFGKLYLFHGRSPLASSLHAVLAQIYAWLDENLTETVMLQVKMEGGTGDKVAFEDLFRAELDAHSEFWALGSTIPTLGEVRGQIQLMRRFSSASGPLGIDVRHWADNSPRFVIPLERPEHLVVQDQYEYTDTVPSFRKLIETKFEAVKALVESAKLDRNPRSWYLNWASAYTSPLSFGVVASPSDIALGREEIEDGYRHFVRGINQSLREEVFESPGEGRVGTILMDFLEEPAPDTVSRILMTNHFIV